MAAKPGVLAQILGAVKIGRLYRRIGVGLTAAGTNRATALVLKHDISDLTTVGSGTGVLLQPAVIGYEMTVYNNGSNALKVYGAGSDTVDGVAGSTGVTLTNARRARFTCTAEGKWISSLLGAVSS